MLKLPHIELKNFNNEAAKTGYVVGFAAMTAAAIINTFCWAIFGAAAAPGRAGFMLAFGVSILAALFSALMSKRKSGQIDALADHAAAIAAGNFEAAYVPKLGTTHAIHVQLNLIAEAQLKRIEEFHRLLEDSRIREERLYEALDEMADEVCVYDPTGMLVSVNRAYTRHCNGIGASVGPGMLRQEVLSVMAQAPGNGVPANEREMWLEHQSHMRELAISGGKPVDSLQRDGKHLRFTLIETPLKNQIEIITDISDIVAGHLEVERCRREVEAADKIKAVTVSRLMNTIRTPMTGVLAAAEMLNNTPLTTSQQSKLDLIRRSSGSLLGVVQDMIEVAGDPPQEVAQEPEQMKLLDVHNSRRAVLLVRSPELLDKITGVLKHDSVQSVSLETVDLVQELLGEIHGESVKVDFVMTDDSGAFEQLEKWKSQARPNAPFQLIDLNKVMTDGFTTPPSPLKSPTLAPSDIPFIEAVASAVEMPVVSAEATTAAIQKVHYEEAHDAVALPQSGLRKRPIEVMVVEDNDVSQIVYDQIMRNSGFNYLIVSSGEEAVSTALREKPGLILMDISMPGLNGLDATKRIRTRLPDENRPVIVGMTQHVLNGDREKCLLSGMDDYAMKPTLPGPLRKQISAWLSLATQKNSLAAQAS
jgi:CheY-like chemotaxis protein